jgi:hypothetical protein
MCWVFLISMNKVTDSICLFVLFACLAVFIRWLSPACIFQGLVDEPFDLTVHTAKFIPCPLFEGLVHIIIYSQYETFFTTHTNGF